MNVGNASRNNPAQAVGIVAAGVDEGFKKTLRQTKNSKVGGVAY